MHKQPFFFWLVPVVALLGLGSAGATNAQTTYPFETTYDTEVK